MNATQLAPVILHDATYDFVLLGPTSEGRTGLLARGPRLDLFLLGTARLTGSRRENWGDQFPGVPIDKVGSGKLTAVHPREAGATVYSVECRARIIDVVARDEVFTFAWIHRGPAPDVTAIQQYFSNAASSIHLAVSGASEEGTALQLAPLIYLCFENERPARPLLPATIWMASVAAFASGIALTWSSIGLARLFGQN